MLILFVWLYMFKCDVYAQLLADQSQKYFWAFYMFLKVILYFCVFSFWSKCIFVFFFKNWFRGCFSRRSRLRASCEMCLKEIKKSYFSYSESCYYLASISRLNSSCEMFLGKNWKFFISYWGHRDCFVTKCFSRKLQCVSRLILWLPNPRKRVFSVFM